MQSRLRKWMRKGGLQNRRMDTSAKNVLYKNADIDAGEKILEK